jgi:transposase
MDLYVGLDVHEKFTYATFVDEKGNAMGEMKVPTSEQGFLTLFASKKQHVLHVVYEASKNWSHIRFLLENAGVKNIVLAHPRKLKAIASARIKTDRLDSKILADLLRANLIPESFMPTEEIIRLRNLCRFRATLSQEHTRTSNRIRSLLARYGYKSDYKNPTCSRARIWLVNLPLSVHEKAELNHLLNTLDALSKERDDISQAIKEEADKRPECKLLCTIPGFADYSSLLILSEIGNVKRFQTPQQLASYAGLVPSTYQSGETARSGRITKQGSTWLRWIVIQCTWQTVKRDNRIARFYHRIAKKKGPQKAIIAAARKTLTIMWSMLQKEQAFKA